MLARLSSTRQAALPGLFGEFEFECSGAQSTPYVTVPAISVGRAKMNVPNFPSGLERIAAYDAAEASGPNLGQTNMIRVSSFNSPRGFIWGHDLCSTKSEEIKGQFDLPVFSLEPILRAGEMLLGSSANPGLRISPGELLPCAYKDSYYYGTGHGVASIGIAIAKNRERDADLFLEDHRHAKIGFDHSQSEELILEYIRAVIAVSSAQGTEYDRLYFSYRVADVLPAELTCLLTAIPYIKLPRILKTAVECSLTSEVFEWQARISDAVRRANLEPI